MPAIEEKAEDKHRCCVFSVDSTQNDLGGYSVRRRPSETGRHPRSSEADAKKISSRPVSTVEMMNHGRFFSSVEIVFELSGSHYFIVFFDAATLGFELNVCPGGFVSHSVFLLSSWMLKKNKKWNEFLVKGPATRKGTSDYCFCSIPGILFKKRSPYRLSYLVIN